MKNTVHKRESLIHEGLRALLARGYDGVGIEEILRAQNVPKGSFYHFFKSKEEFSCCVLAAYSAHYATIRAKIFLDMKDSPSIRLRRYFKLLERELSQSIVEGGCLLGVFAQTAGNRGPALRKQLIESFREWEESLTLVVVEAQQRGDIASDRDAQLIAALLIDAYEGAIVRVKASGKMLAYRRFMKQVLEPLLWSGTTHKNGLATPYGD